MGFEEGALTRLRRYREEASRSLIRSQEAEEITRRFAGRLFGGLEYTAALGREADFDVQTRREKGAFTLQVSAGAGAEARATFGFVAGAAAEVDEDLVHQDLSRYSLDPSGYSGRILGFSRESQ